MECLCIRIIPSLFYQSPMSMIRLFCCTILSLLKPTNEFHNIYCSFQRLYLFSTQQFSSKKFMRRLILFSISILAVVLIYATEASAATITVGTSTNWSTLTGGSGPGGLPSSADAIVVNTAATLTVNVANAVCASIQLGGPTTGSGAGTLLFSS